MKENLEDKIDRNNRIAFRTGMGIFAGGIAYPIIAGAYDAFVGLPGTHLTDSILATSGAGAGAYATCVIADRINTGKPTDRGEFQSELLGWTIFGAVTSFPLTGPLYSLGTLMGMAAYVAVDLVK